MRINVVYTGEACRLLQVTQKCIAAAQQAALDNAGGSLPLKPDPSGWASDFLSSLGDKTSGVESAFFTDASSALQRVSGFATVVNLFTSLSTAYSQRGL